MLVRHHPGSRRAGLLVADDAGFLRAAELAFDEAVTTHRFIQLFTHLESLSVASFLLLRCFLSHAGMLSQRCFQLGPVVLGIAVGNARQARRVEEPCPPEIIPADESNHG